MQKLYVLLATVFVALNAFCQIEPVQLVAGTYQENFNSLAATGTSSATPTGWGLFETGTSASVNNLYTAGTGSGTAGDTYSFGSAGNSDRAFGTLRSGTLNATIGAAFRNNTGKTITSVTIAYTGEQWRLGTVNRGADRMDFQYSLNATALNAGTWTDVDGLDFNGPVTTGTIGFLNGNDLANRTTINQTISDLVIPSGAIFYIRWIEFDAPNADDGLAIDDFSLSFTTGGDVPPPPPPTAVTVDNGSHASEPSTPGSFEISFSQPTTGPASFTYAFAGSASFGTDYQVSTSNSSVIIDAASGTLTIPAGVSSLTVMATPVDDAIAEGTENITFTLSNPPANFTLTTPGATINLLDNDQETISVAAGVQAAEPATNGSFIINLSSPAPAGGVTVSYMLGGTASSTTDYSDANAGTVLIPAGTSSATITLLVKDDLLFEGTETIILTLTGTSGSYTITTGQASINLTDNEVPKVVINQVYGGGGNSGATYTHDFIELYNNEDVPVNLDGWSVQYAGATSGTWAKTDLSGIIPAKGFFLIQQTKGSGGNRSLPAPDVTGAIAMGAGSGKVLLSTTQTALSGANPSGAPVIDKVGYGSNATGFETAPKQGADNITAIKRATDGVDTDNNSTDFIEAMPEPRNSGYTTTAPVIVSLTPPDNSTGLPYNIQTRIVFDKPVQKGTGFITIDENGVQQQIPVGAPEVTVTGNTVIIGLTYQSGKAYAITIDAGAFKDSYGNNFAGIAGNTGWNFSIYNSTVSATVPVSFELQNCTGNGLLPDGFTQFSVQGESVWNCTPFGRDPQQPKGTAPFPNAVQMSGFANNTNVPNMDWLISPAFDLTGTTFPLLSFWSRTAFNGLPLQLKVSTDYPGTGDPRNYTWTDLNGKFPNQGSNEWTLSDNINLAAFKAERVYVAFVYTSTDDDGARWTLDDISIVNSTIAPPPALTVGARDIQFNYVDAGSSAVKPVIITGNDITGDMTVSATGAFLLSKDGTQFSTSIVYTQEEANNTPKTVYVQFAPTAINQNFEGTVTVNSSGLSSTINVKGTSIDPATTLEVVNWNIEWFGSTANGPTNETLQEQNVVKILKNTDADVYGLMEIVDEAKLKRVVEQLDGYDYVISNYSSHTNTAANPPSALAAAQKLAFVYRTSVVKNLSTRALLSVGINTREDLTNPYYSQWSSGRFPYMMDAEVTLGGVTKNVKFILIHAKANTNPVDVSYQRRKAGADALHDSLRILFPTDNLLLLGDFNDDLDQSITAGFTTTSWDKFVDDEVEYKAVTLPLSLAGRKSTVSYNDVIDHVVVSNEMFNWYMTSSAGVLTDVAGLVSSYGNTTSDHYPVFTRYMFCNLTCPENITVETDLGKCGATVQFTAGAGMTCGTVSYSRPSGSFFPVGTTTVTATATTGETCSFTVTVDDREAPVVRTKPVTLQLDDHGRASVTAEGVNDGSYDPCGVISVSLDKNSFDCSNLGTNEVILTVTDKNGNKANAKASVVIEDKIAPAVNCPQDMTVLPTSLSGTTVQYSLTVSDNCGTPVVEQLEGKASGTTFPIGTTVNRFRITDVAGNEIYCSFKVTVSDPYCDNKKDDRKVFVCHNGNTNCISVNALQAQLDKGAKLGRCEWYSTTSHLVVQRDVTPAAGAAISLQTYPNPFGKTTTIRYSLPEAANVSIGIYDLAGKQVSSVFRGLRNAGTYAVTYQPGGISAGIYYCRMTAVVNGQETVQTQKLMKLE